MLIEMQSGPDIGAMNLIAPVLVAILFVSACSFLREPNRRNFNAIMIAGAGAAYLNGGFGKWEFVFMAIVTYFAYRGLQSYNFIGVGWLFHTVWDVLHHLYGNPIVPFAPASSLGCAICDPLIALWCFAGAPSISHRAATKSKNLSVHQPLAASNIRKGDGFLLRAFYQGDQKGGRRKGAATLLRMTTAAGARSESRG